MTSKSIYTGMPEVSLEEGSVASLICSVDYERMYLLARSLPKWTNRSIQTVTECLQQWLVDALDRTDNSGELQTLARLIQRLQVYKRPEATPGVDVSIHYSVWNSLIVMINIRLSALEARVDRSVGDSPIQQQLKDAIAYLFSPKRVSELCVELGLSNTRMFEVLELAEQAGLITRRIEPNEQWVVITPKWRHGIY